MSEQISVPKLPEVEIIQDGKRVDTSAIDNYDEFMAFLMQAAATSHLAKIKRYFEDRTSIGREVNFELVITPNLQEIILPRPCQSFYIINDGPGDIFVEINAAGFGATRLRRLDEKTVNFETHKLEQVNVWSAAGTNANARAVAKF